MADGDWHRVADGDWHRVADGDWHRVAREQREEAELDGGELHLLAADDDAALREIEDEVADRDARLPLGDDDTFGYLSVAARAEAPLSFIPESLGDWTLRGSVEWISLGDNLESANSGDDDEIVLLLGVAVSF